ncbi:MAG TPA: ABC transporter ATP-binding protein [Dictyobacter sp.]|jgi:putative ABC transport system ATP-binding protein|nr:ABC transporter ATP-binding protein [Dictyobacter sp.]
MIIKAQDITKTYRSGQLRVEALSHVSLDIQEGEMISIMGPSGCGKTTLLNCLSGLDTIDEGEIFIRNDNLRLLSDSERTTYRAQHMGFIFQDFNLLPVLTAVENVELSMLITGVAARKARKRALEMLDIVGLAERAYHRPAELSGGQRQRVTIARALSNNPDIVWADEPTGNLDSETAQEIMHLLTQLNREQQQTFVIVTHAPDIGKITHRTIQMRDGKIVSTT